MASEYFEEVIFPSLPKQISPAVLNHSNASINIFERIYCGKKLGWFSLIECVQCPMKNKTLEEILENDVGCTGEK
jgi:hypothetical protein